MRLIRRNITAEEFTPEEGGQVPQFYGHAEILTQKSDGAIAILLEFAFLFGDLFPFGYAHAAPPCSRTARLQRLKVLGFPRDGAIWRISGRQAEQYTSGLSARRSHKPPQRS